VWLGYVVPALKKTEKCLGTYVGRKGKTVSGVCCFVEQRSDGLDYVVLSVECGLLVLDKRCCTWLVSVRELSGTLNARYLHEVGVVPSFSSRKLDPHALRKLFTGLLCLATTTTSMARTAMTLIVGEVVRTAFVSRKKRLHAVLNQQIPRP
jgi:hypothetical protein